MMVFQKESPFPREYFQVNHVKLQGCRTFILAITKCVALSICGFSYATVDHKAFHLFTFSVEVSMRKTKTPDPRIPSSFWGAAQELLSNHHFWGRKNFHDMKRKTSTWWLKVTFLGWWKRDPFKGHKWPPTIGDEKVTAWITDLNRINQRNILGWIHHAINEQQRSRSTKREHFWDVPNPQLIKELLRLAEGRKKSVGYSSLFNEKSWKTKDCAWNYCIKQTWWYGRNESQGLFWQHHRIANQKQKQKSFDKTSRSVWSPDSDEVV